MQNINKVCCCDGGDGRATLGGILILGCCTDTWVGAECRSVFVSPCLDSSRLDTA